MDPKHFVVTPDASVSDIDLNAEDFRLKDGSRLTEERAAEREALQAERTRQIANLKPGRKSLTGEGQHSPVLQVRLPRDLDSRIRAIAAERKTTASALARQALEQYLSEKP